nr:SIMPL domain-containing protein [Pseudoxanthomonas sp.]
MRMIHRLVCAMALLSAPMLASAQMNALPAQPHLLVKGQGVRTVIPDRFTVALDLQVTDLDTDAARQKVQASAAQVIEAFKRNQVILESLQASSLSVAPDYDWRDNKREFKGTQVRRKVRGTFTRLEDTQAFLAQIKASSELQIASLEPGYSAEATLRGQLKREAGEQTRHTAARLAEAYGARIRGLYSISDVAPDFAYGVQAGTWPSGPVEVIEPRPADLYQPAAPAAPPAPAESLAAGTLTFTENVYAIFLIAP